MIVLQNTNLPLSTDFLIEKKDPIFFKKLTFKDLNGTLFLQKADFHRSKITFEELNGTLLLVKTLTLMKCRWACDCCLF